MRPPEASMISIYHFSFPFFHCSLLTAHYSLLIFLLLIAHFLVAHCFHTVLVAIAGGIAAARRAGTNTAS